MAWPYTRGIRIDKNKLVLFNKNGLFAKIDKFGHFFAKNCMKPPEAAVGTLIKSERPCNSGHFLFWSCF